MMTLRQQRRAERKRRKAYDDQIRLERNGAPIPGEIAELMTKPVVRALYQAKVDVKGEALPLPISPKMGRSAAEMICTFVAAQIRNGKRPTWGNPRVELCL